MGSLTHTQGYRGAVVGRTTAIRSVGIDAEPHGVLPDGVLNAVSLPAERYEMVPSRADCTGIGSCSAPKKQLTRCGSR